MCLQSEQGISIPRLVAYGEISGTACKFIAFQLLGESLEDVLQENQEEVDPKPLKFRVLKHQNLELHREYSIQLSFQMVLTMSSFYMDGSIQSPPLTHTHPSAEANSC